MKVTFPRYLWPLDKVTLTISRKGLVNVTFSSILYLNGPISYTSSSHQRSNFVLCIVHFSLKLSTLTLNSLVKRKFTFSFTPSIDAVGDFRVRENPQLTVFHILFLREHNRLVRELDRVNGGCWSQERLFNEARKINIAVYQVGIG